MSSGELFFFGGKQFPIKSLNQHVFFMGRTGSGKTTGIRDLLRDVLPEIGNHRDDGGWRCFLYDPKWDQVDFLNGMSLQVEPLVINPFRSDTVAWDMASDVTGPGSAYAVSRILFPVEESVAQPYFGNAAFHLLYGAFLAFIYALPKKWTARHIALLMRDENLLRQLLLQCPATRYLVPLYLPESDKLTRSIMSTIATKMVQFEIVFSLWDYAMREGSKFSLRDFVNSEQILVMGNHEEAREASDAVFRAIVKRLTELLLSQPRNEKRRTIICIDELREAGGREPLDGLHSLHVRGRSYGVCCILAAQGVSGIKQVYGEHVASELISQSNFKAFLGLSDFDSAEFASKQFGEQELIESRNQAGQSISQSMEGPSFQASQGANEQLRQRAVVTPYELMELPPAGPRNGIPGKYRTPYGSFASTYDFMSRLTPEKHIPGKYEIRPEEQQYLREWEEDELEALGLSLRAQPRAKGPTGQNSQLPSNPNRPRDRRRRHGEVDNEVDE